MPQLVVPGAVLVRLIWSAAGIPYAVNVLGARKTGATNIDQGLANTLGGAIKGSFTSSTQVGVVHTTVALANVGVRDISEPNNPEFIDSAAAVPGTAVGDLLPPQVAMCATLRTADAGRSFRGRFYACGYTETHNTSNGTALAAVTTVLQNFLIAVQGNLSASGLELAIVSRKQLAVTPVTLIQVRNTVWDTIRKRAVPGI